MIRKRFQTPKRNQLANDGLNTNAPFTFNSAAVGINFDFSSESETGIFEVKSGTVKVSRTSDDYIFAFDVITQTDIQARGLFSRTLDIHDYYNTKRSIFNPFKLNIE